MKDQISREQYEEDLIRRQAEHLDNIRSKQNKAWKPCLHDSCPKCLGTGRQSDGSFCAHYIYCSCPKCSPSSYTAGYSIISTLILFFLLLTSCTPENICKYEGLQIVDKWSDGVVGYLIDIRTESSIKQGIPVIKYDWDKYQIGDTINCKLK